MEMSRLFRERLAVRDPAAEQVVLWDQAGFHPRPGLDELPERIPVLPLPPDSPELNPVEGRGDVLKDRIANTRWQTLESLEAALGGEAASHLRACRARAKVGSSPLAHRTSNRCRHRE